MFASCHFMGAAEDTRPIGEAKDSTARGTASGRGFGPRCSPVRLGATRSRGARCRPRRESEPLITRNERPSSQRETSLLHWTINKSPLCPWGSYFIFQACSLPGVLERSSRKATGASAPKTRRNARAAGGRLPTPAPAGRWTDLSLRLRPVQSESPLPIPPPLWHSILHWQVVSSLKRGTLVHRVPQRA